MSNKMTWEEMLDPQCKQMEMASMLELNYVLNPVGAAATAKLMRNMARLLDKTHRQITVQELAALKSIDDLFK